MSFGCALAVYVLHWFPRKYLCCVHFVLAIGIRGYCIKDFAVGSSLSIDFAACFV